jgi:hypothetical protein
MVTSGLTAWSRAGEDDGLILDDFHYPLRTWRVLVVGRPSWIQVARTVIGPRSAGPVPEELFAQIEPDARKIIWCPPYLAYAACDESWARWYVHLGYGISVEGSPIREAIIEAFGVDDDRQILLCVDEILESFVADIMRFRGLDKS